MISTDKYAEQVEAREYSYCSATYRDPLRWQKFLVWTPHRKDAVLRATRYARQTWGQPDEIRVYPRNYVRQARQLLAVGRHES